MDKKRNEKATVSEAMRETLGNIQNIINIRLEEYDDGYSMDKSNYTRKKMNTEDDRVNSLKDICEAIVMIAEHVHNKMPYMNFVYDDEGQLYEEKTLLKKLKKEQKV